MPHVTFVHGIANKPPAARLKDEWLRELSLAGLDLGGEGVTTSMVYWADLMYETPEAETGGIETLLSDPEMDASVVTPLALNDADARFVTRLAAKLGATLLADEIPAAKERPSAEERIPLPWALKERFLRSFLRDVHAYLFDVEVSPRPGERHQVRRTIRERFVRALADAPESGRHVVVGHSLGTVIAYDCLKNVPGCPSVDALLTIGSPLGLDEVQDRLVPGYSRRDGFPGTVGRWTNFSDRLDVVCGLAPRLAEDFGRSGVSAITDVMVENTGRWRHDAGQYLRQEAIRTALSSELEL